MGIKAMKKFSVEKTQQKLMMWLYQICLREGVSEYHCISQAKNIPVYSI